MRILSVNTSYHSGGAANIAKMIHENINDKKIKNQFVSTSNIDSESHIYFDIGFSKYLNYIKSRFFGLDSRNYNKSRKFFYNILNDNYDIFHFHNLHGYYFDLKSLLLIKKKKIIITLHDMWLFTGHCSNSLDCKKFELGCDKCPYLNTYPKMQFDFTKKNYDNKKTIFDQMENLTLIAPSEWMYDNLKKSFLSKHTIKLINNGVNKDIFYNRKINYLKEKYKISSKTTLILFSSADLNNYMKGSIYVKQIIQAIKDHDVKIITVGKKNRQLENFISESKIINIGYLKDKNIIAQIFSSVDLYIHTSIAENYSCTIQEVLACGTPTVAFNIGGNKELINSNNGKIFEISNFPAMVDYIIYMIINKIELNELNSKTRKNIHNIFDMNYMINKYKEVYNYEGKGNE